MELKFYRVLKADPIGDPWTPGAVGAKPLQSFWCQFEGVDNPVMMSKQVPNTPSLTYGQFGYLVEATSAKGNPYYKFKGQKAPDELEQPRYAAADASVATQPISSAQVQTGDFVTRDEFDTLSDTLTELAIHVEKLAESKGITFDAEDLAGMVDTVKTKDVDKETLEDIFGGPMGEIVEIPDDSNK